MEYTVDYFISKFEAIPEDKWHVGSYVNYMNQFQCCALGHCGCRSFDNETLEAINLDLLFIETPYIVTLINDGHEPDYKQQTPKQRILAALHDIKKQQENE